MKYRKKLFTTGEIARIVDTTPKTVAKWIDDGELKGTRLPGMVERRVHRDDARAFFVKRGWDWAVKEIDEWDGPDAEDSSTAPPPPKANPKKK